MNLEKAVEATDEHRSSQIKRGLREEQESPGG
jgi:hypothetical protein